MKKLTERAKKMEYKVFSSGKRDGYELIVPRDKFFTDLPTNIEKEFRGSVFAVQKIADPNITSVITEKGYYVGKLNTP